MTPAGISETSKFYQFLSVDVRVMPRDKALLDTIPPDSLDQVWMFSDHSVVSTPLEP